MKNPRTIKSYAVVNKDKPKISAIDIFSHQDFKVLKYEKKCLVEIKFIKYIK